MTIEQDRARKAHEDVSRIADSSEAERKRYATVVHELTTMIHASGLVRAVEAASSYTNVEKNKMATILLNQLGGQLKRIDEKICDQQSLQKRARSEKDLQKYMLLGREMQACLIWYRRFVQSILKINPTEAATSEDNQ